MCLLVLPHSLVDILLDLTVTNCPEEMLWSSIADYFNEHAPPDVKKRCKNLSQKKHYVVNVLKMPLQFDAWLAHLMLGLIDQGCQGCRHYQARVIVLKPVSWILNLS